MKKLISFVLMLIMVVGSFGSVLAAPKVPAAQPEEGAREAVILEKNPFHCNTFGGNGRAYAELFQEKLAADKALKKAGIGGVNEGIIYLSDNAWLLENTTDYVCSVCGRTEWVSFSNKSGVPNGKNMQFTHAAPVNFTEIVKLWDDGEGNTSEEGPEGVAAIFDIYQFGGTDTDGNPIRGEIVVEGATPGVRYSVEPGTYVVAERIKDGFVIQPDQVITVTYDKSATVEFTNVPEIIPAGALSLMKTVDGEPINEWVVVIDDETSYSILDVMDDIIFDAYVVDGDGASYEGKTPFKTATLDLDGAIEFGELPVGWYAIVENFTEDSLASKIFKAPKVQYFEVHEDGTITAGAFNFDADWTEPEKTFTQVNAVAASDYVLDEEILDAAVTAPGNSHVSARANVANAFGPADALQNAGNNLFTGLAFFPEGVTYYFGDDENSIQEIYNNPDETLPDLSFIEVTWNNNWHTEAVDVYLVDAFLDDGTRVDSLLIGRVFNRKNLANRQENGFGFDVELKGNFTYTNVFFPDDVVKASAVRLVDATKAVNTPVATHTSYKPYDDGYDLDAMVAYYTLPSTNFENKLETEPPVDPYATLTVTAEVDLFKKVENMKWVPEYDGVKADTWVTWLGDTDGGTWNNGHTYVKVNVAAAENGITYTIADSSKSNRPIEYTYDVKISGSNLVITFPENLVEVGIVKAQAFESAPGKTPPGSMNEWDGEGSFVIPMPANYGEDVYLSFHIGGAIVWDTGEWELCCDVSEPCTTCPIPTLTAKLYDNEGNPITKMVEEVEVPVEAVLEDTLEGLQAVFAELPYGEYTVKLFNGETELGEKTVVLSEEADLGTAYFTEISLRCACDTVVIKDKEHAHILLDEGTPLATFMVNFSDEYFSDDYFYDDYSYDEYYYDDSDEYFEEVEEIEVIEEVEEVKDVEEVEELVELI